MPAYNWNRTKKCSTEIREWTRKHTQKKRAPKIWQIQSEHDNRSSDLRWSQLRTSAYPGFSTRQDSSRSRRGVNVEVQFTCKGTVLFLLAPIQKSKLGRVRWARQLCQSFRYDNCRRFLPWIWQFYIQNPTPTVVIAKFETPALSSRTCHKDSNPTKIENLVALCKVLLMFSKQHIY